MPLQACLRANQVIGHAFVVGELVLGGLAPARRRLLQWLPQITVATDEEVLALVDRAGLVGFGIGWVDCHLLAAVALSDGRSTLWTRDRKLAACAHELGLRFQGEKGLTVHTP